VAEQKPDLGVKLVAGASLHGVRQIANDDVKLLGAPLKLDPAQGPGTQAFKSSTVGHEIMRMEKFAE
jgi:hypothetical protein